MHKAFKRLCTPEKANAAMPGAGEKDPFWPEGVAPTFASVKAQNEAKIVDSMGEELVETVWHCSKCGCVTGKSLKDDRYCSSCYDREVQNSALAQRANSNWMEQSEALGLALFERQPEESDLEWMIWDRYRAFYPNKLPTWAMLAGLCNTSVAKVVQTSQRWSFRVRLVAWARFTDNGIQEKRIAAIKEMNQKQLSMSQRLMDKLSEAIDIIDPTTLKPGEIANLMKLSTELERRIVTSVDEKIDSDIIDAKNKQVLLTKPEDLGEVASILNSLGLLQGKTIGIEQTTRIIAKEND